MTTLPQTSGDPPTTATTVTQAIVRKPTSEEIARSKRDTETAKQLLEATIHKHGKTPVFIKVPLMVTHMSDDKPICQVCKKKFQHPGEGPRYPIMVHANHYACAECAKGLRNACPLCRVPVTTRTKKTATIKDVIQALTMQQAIQEQTGDISAGRGGPDSVVVNLNLFDGERADINVNYDSRWSMHRGSAIYYSPFGWRRVAAIIPNLDTAFGLWSTAYM